MPNYFSSQTFQFLTRLTLNNSREFFEQHKAEYERNVREPALALIRDFAPRLRGISRHFVASDKKVGGSLMRVNRDVRFSADKSPYKTNVGIQFRHEAGKDVHAPGLYLHVSPEECFLGSGIWHPEPEVLALIRERILEKPKAWQKAAFAPSFREHFELSGDSLKRAPRGIGADHPFVRDLMRKDHIAILSLTERQVVSRNLPEMMAERLALSRPYLKFLCAAQGLPF